MNIRSLIVKVILCLTLNVNTSAQIVDTSNDIKLEGYIVEMYFIDSKNNFLVHEGDVFILKYEFSKKNIELHKLYAIDRRRDSLLKIAQFEPFGSLNDLYFQGKLQRVFYDTTSLYQSKLLKKRRKREYLYRYYPTIAYCSSFILTKQQLLKVIPYDQYHFSSEKTKVFLINRITLAYKSAL